jgi:hypothetical protein
VCVLGLCEEAEEGRGGGGHALRGGGGGGEPAVKPDALFVELHGAFY